jgi:hypothetical protein
MEIDAKPTPAGRAILSVRMVDIETDYPVVSGWWEAHGWPEPLLLAMIPKLGIMVERNGEPCLAGWVYMDNSCGVSMLEFVVGNPATPPRDVLRSIEHLTAAARMCASQNGYSIMLTYCKTMSLAKAFQKNGFKLTDDGMKHLVIKV